MKVFGVVVALCCAGQAAAGSTGAGPLHGLRSALMTQHKQRPGGNMNARRRWSMEVRGTIGERERGERACSICSVSLECSVLFVDTRALSLDRVFRIRCRSGAAGYSAVAPAVMCVPRCGGSLTKTPLGNRDSRCFVQQQESGKLGACRKRFRYSSVVGGGG